MMAKVRLRATSACNSGWDMVFSSSWIVLQFPSTEAGHQIGPCVMAVSSVGDMEGAVAVAMAESSKNHNLYCSIAGNAVSIMGDG